MSLLWTLLFRRIIHFQKLTAGHSAEEKVSVELSLCMTSLPESQGMSWKRRLKSCGNWWNPWPNNATQTQGCQHPSPTPSWGTTDIWWMLREKEQFSLRRYWLYGIQGLFRGYLKSEVRGGGERETVSWAPGMGGPIGFHTKTENSTENRLWVC